MIACPRGCPADLCVAEENPNPDRCARPRIIGYARAEDLALVSPAGSLRMVIASQPRGDYCVPTIAGEPL